MTAVVGAAMAVALSTAPAGAEDRIFLECRDSDGVSVNLGDMSATSIGEELSGIADPSGAYPNSALVLSYYESASSSSTPTTPGDLTYDGIMVVRPTATSSPIFWRALSQGEVWPQCTLYFTRSSSSASTGTLYAKIVLTTVAITRIEPRAVAQLDLAGDGRAHLETIVFLPEVIKWSAYGSSGEVTWTHNLSTGLPMGR